MRTFGLFVGALVCCSTGATADSPNFCQAAQLSLQRQEHQQAERLARRCLQHNPNHSQARIVLSRALAAQQRYGQAIAQLDRVLYRYPRDGDLLVLRVRLLAWSGDLNGAWSQLLQLPTSSFADPETVLLGANLAFWRKDYLEAVLRYSDFLEVQPGDTTALRNRGLAWRQQGEPKQALLDFERLCKLDAAQCGLKTELQQEQARFSLMLMPAYYHIVDRPPAGRLSSIFRAQVFPQLQAGAQAELRYRDFGQGGLTDVYLQGDATLNHDSGLFVTVGAGFSILPQFSPQWTAQVEPGYAFAFGLELYLKYWRLQFAQGGAHVISPAFYYGLGRFGFYSRCYFAIDDQRGPTLALMSKISLRPGPPWQLFLGGGFGDRSEYLEPRQVDLSGSAFAVAGASWDLHWRHRFLLEVLLRRETSDQQIYLEAQTALGYRLRF